MLRAKSAVAFHLPACGNNGDWREEASSRRRDPKDLPSKCQGGGAPSVPAQSHVQFILLADLWEFVLFFGPAKTQTPPVCSMKTLQPSSDLDR